jgi:hypothetical protein
MLRSGLARSAKQAGVGLTERRAGTGVLAQMHRAGGPHPPRPSARHLTRPTSDWLCAGRVARRASSSRASSEGDGAAAAAAAGQASPRAAPHVPVPAAAAYCELVPPLRWQDTPGITSPGAARRRHPRPASATPARLLLTRRPCHNTSVLGLGVRLFRSPRGRLMRRVPAEPCGASFHIYMSWTGQGSHGAAGAYEASCCVSRADCLGGA